MSEERKEAALALMRYTHLHSAHDNDENSMSGTQGWERFEHQSEKSVVVASDGRQASVLTRTAGPEKDMVFVQVKLRAGLWSVVVLTPEGTVAGMARASTAKEAVENARTGLPG